MYKTQGLKNGRIEVADALRGIAVMGIILYHSVEHFNVFAPAVAHTLPCDGTVFSILTVLLSGKMYGIFAILFGLSFFIMRDNQEQKGKDFSLRFAWRMVLLFLFGFVNTCFYDGDILTTYALLGFLLIPAGYLSNKVLWAITIFLLIQPVDIFCAITGMNPEFSWVGENYMRMTEAHVNGNFFEAICANIKYAFPTTMGWFITHGRLTQTLGLFYLGLLLGRSRIFYNEGNNLRTWRVIAGVAALCVILGSVVPFGNLDSVLRPIWNLSMIMLLMGVVVLCWYRFDGFRNGLSHICFFGRFSLTNYLLQSLLGSFIFYGFGLGMATQLGTVYSLLVGAGIVIVQFLLLRLWARNHQRGPLESLWRYLTWLGK